VTLLISSVTSLAAISTSAGAAGTTSSTTTLASSAPTGSALAAPVTYTATVVPTSGSGATPTGSVAFTDNGTALAGCTSVAMVAGTGSNATAQCTPVPSAMSAGSHPIVANYAGDPTYSGSASPTLTQTVATTTSTTVITSAPASPSPFGVAVTYTATVTAGGGVTAFTPTGTVSFSDSASVLCATAALGAVSAGVARAICVEPAASVTVGTHAITSTYSADTNFTAGAGGSLSQVVVLDSTAIVLGSAPASASTLGAAVTYTATITAGSAVTANPTGSVTFKDGATTLCSPTVSTTAIPGVVVATCTEPGSSMSGGGHTVTATYGGDPNFATSNTTLTQTVTAATTTTVVTTSGNNSAVGQSVTYTATVTPSAFPFPITGTVAFKDNGTTISTCSAQAVSSGASSGTATCSTSAATMSFGTHPITAVYTATPNYGTSTAPALTQTVVQGTTSTTVTSSADPTTGGLGLTYTATVVVAGGTAIPATGTVAFTDSQPGPGSTVLCATASFNGTTATCAVAAAQQTTGTHTVTATYSGDTSFTGSTNTLVQTVNIASSSVGVTASPTSPSGLAVGVDYTVTVSADNGSTLSPGKASPGTVTVTDTNPASVTSTLCTLSSPQSTAPGTSTWECAEAAANMTAGDHLISVSFSGDGYFAPSTTTYTQTVSPHTAGSTTTAVSSPGSPSYVGDPVTYTASVNGDSVFTPAGTVAFYNGNGLLPGCAAVPANSGSGSAATYQCTEAGSMLPVGSQQIHAVFSGDPNYTATSTSPTIIQVVSMGATSTVVGDTPGTADPSLAGIPTGYTATITPSQSTAIEPGGTVVFYDNGSPITGCTTATVTTGATNSTATCAEASLSMLVGSHLITAVYSGDVNYITSDNIGSPFNQQVNRNTTTTTVAVSSSGSSITGQPVNFTATVTAGGVALGNALTPTGSVTFSDSSGGLCTVQLSVSAAGVASANCTFSSANFTVGSADQITAAYNADTQYTASTGTTTAPSFSPAPTDASIASSTTAHPGHGNASVVNAPVTYITTFSDPDNGLVNPTGTVSYADTYLGVTTPLCTVPLVQPIDPTSGNIVNTGTSTAKCTESANMLAGTHHITATYSGDANYTTATSPSSVTWDQIVVADDTTITLTNPLPANGSTFPANNLVYSVYTPVTLQATLASLTGTTPFTANGDGGVTFYMNGVAINPTNFPTAPNGAVTPNCTDMPVSASPTATITCAAFPMLKGSDKFTVAYLDSSGQAGYNSDLGTSSYTWQVVYFATNTQVVSNPAAPVTGQSVTLTAPVTPSSGAAQLPTGTLTFSVNGTPVTCQSPATLDTSNPPVASCVLPNGLPGGTDVIQAVYPGDPWYAASIGSLSMTVGQAATTTTAFTITTSTGSTSPVSGQTLKFTVGSVAPVAPGVGVPTGTVAITTPSTAKTLCVVTLANGTGSCFDSSVQVPSGTQVPFTATYSGDAGFTGSSTTSSINIAPETALVTNIATSPTTVTYGQPMTYTVTLAPQFAGTTTTGTVALTASTQAGPGAPLVRSTLCTITLVSSSNNSGSCTFTPSVATGFLPTGADKFTATYSGDADFAAGTTGTTTAFVNRSSAVTAVTVNPQNPVYGQLPSFAITVTPAISGTTPTGTVQILSSQTGLTPLCTYTLSALLTYGSVVGSCAAAQLLVAQNNVTFTANYSGDTNFTTGTGSTLTNIQKAGTTTTVTPTTVNPTYGQPQTFAVTVAPQVAGVTPTGAVTITTPGVLQPLCTVTLSGGAGTCTTTLAVPVGAGIVYQASYSGDTNFLASTGLSAANTITTTPATVSIATTQSSTAYGSETGQVISSTVVTTTTGTPTGTVTYAVGATTLCVATVVNGAASCSPISGTALAVGPQSITATYSGDANFSAPATAPTKTWTITKSTAVMTTGVSTATVIYGNESQAAFSATVASSGTGTPTGTVSFKQGVTTLCTVTLTNGTGTCTPTAAALNAAGSAYTVVATYSGDPNFAAPSTQNISLTVNKASTTTTLTITPSTFGYGNETGVTLTATVGPQFSGTPTGTVSLKAGATTLCPAPTLSAGTASCTISSQTLLAAGSYTVIATYSGDANFATSPTFGFVTVTQATTSSAVTVSPASIALGHENTAVFTPTLTAVPVSSGTPTGSVTVTATNNATSAVTPICVLSAANADGSHPCSPSSTSLLATGTYTITTTYSGDTNFTGSTGTGNLTVTPASAGSLTLALTPSGTSVAYGNETALTYSVSLGSASPIPTGIVTIKSGTTSLCTVTLTNANGSCAIGSPTLLGVSATNPVVATYNGDANYSGTVSSTASVNLAIVKAPTTSGFVLSTSVVTYGGLSATTVTATVTPGFTYGNATGTVTITAGVGVGGTTLCTVTLTGPSNNVGSCSPANAALAVPGSPYSLNATYSGDANFTGSTSSAQTLTVIPAVTATTLTETPATVVVGHETAATFTPIVTAAPVTAGSPTGSVSVVATNNGTHLATVLCTMSAVQADGAHTCVPASDIGLAPGAYTLTATYPGDPNFTGSTGTAGNQLSVVQAPAAGLTLNLTPSTTTIPYGNEGSVAYTVSFGATVPTPTGTVAIRTTSGTATTTLCTVTLNDGTGACAISPPTLIGVSATNPVVATYAGDVDYSGTVSSGTAINLAITAAATSTTVNVVPAGVIYGSEHAALITVAVNPAYSGTPTGTVSVTTTVAGSPVVLCTLSLPATTCTPADTVMPAGTTYDLTATYSGDTNFTGSTGIDLGALTVSPATTATSLVLSASTVQYGISPTFTAAVSPTTTGTPTGTVAIIAYVSGSPVTLCTINLPATTCSGTGTALATAPPPYSVIAVYSGDGNFTTSTSSSQNLTVSSNSTTTITTLSPPSVAYGNESHAVITATIAHTGAGVPTGTVDVTYSGTTVCVITLSGGTGTCSPGNTDFVVGGPYFSIATYSGDSAYTGSSSTPISLTVTKAATTPSVGASPSTVTYGDLSSSVLTATVTPAYAGTPTGTVTFTSGSTSLCSVTLPVTTCTTPTGVQLGVGNHAVTAAFSGDPNFSSSAATTSSVITVTQASTTTAVSVAPTSVAFGGEDSTTFSASVTPQFSGTPTGTITVSTGITPLCTVYLPSSTCTITAQALPVGGPYALTAVYQGDADFTGSTGSDPSGLTVTRATTATTVGVSPASAAYGSEQGVTLSAQVHLAAAGTVTPTGTVVFTTGSTTLCTVAVSTLVGVTSGSCTVPTHALAASATPYDITATYSGDTSFTGSNGTATGALTIVQAPTTMALSSSPATTSYGNESSVALQSLIGTDLAGTPTGTVTFSSGGTPLCTTTVNPAPGGGDAVCTLADTALPASSSAYPVTASYSGDTNFSVSSTTTASQITVDKASTTTVITAVTPGSITYGLTGPVIDVSVTPQYAGTPTGTVTTTAMVDGNPVTVCTMTLPTTSCVGPPMSLAASATPYDLTATYTGDTDFTTSNGSDVGALTVNQALSTTAVSVAPAAVGFGSEAGAVFTVGVTVGGPGNQGTATGTVSVTASTPSGPVTVCTVTLPRGVTGGTCSPAADVLPVGGPYDITATYSGDGNVASSTTTIDGAFSVAKATTSTDLTSIIPDSVVYGAESQATLSATVEPVASGTPTGTVNFSTTVDGSPVTLCTGAVGLDGTVRCSPTDGLLPASATSYTVTATYSGDADFTGSADTSSNAFTVIPATTTTTVTSGLQNATYGNEHTVTLTAVVGSPTTVTPTGDVNFGTTGPNGPAELCDAPVTVGPDGSVATCTLPDTVLDANLVPFDVTATFSGSADVAGSTGSAPASLTITSASTTTSVVSVDPNPVDFGRTGPTVTVSVAPQYRGSPTGSVAVTATNGTTLATTPLCTVTLPVGVPGGGGAASTGSCTPVALTLTPEVYDLRATFTPDAGNFMSSTTAVDAGLTVSMDTTTAAVTSVVPNPVASGAENAARITTTITGVSASPVAPAPTGTVTVTTQIGTSTVTVCVAILTQPGGVGTPVTATCSPIANALPVGAYPLVATYGGDAHYSGSVSSSSTLTVTKGAVTLTATTSAASVLPGRPVTFTATLAHVAGLTVPTGTVRFTDATSGAVLCGAAQVSTSGGVTRATCTAILPTTPTQQIVATYSGDANFDTTAGTVAQLIEHGYWTVAKDGGVFAFGDAQFHGSMGGKPLNQPIVGIAGTADAGGYWLVASDGGIFAFGDATFYGSMGNQRLNAPMVGMQPTRDGKGYWMVASDGGVFNFGDAAFYGSTGGLHLTSPIVGMVATDDGLGYYLVAANGGVYAFGDAHFAGGAPATSSPIVGLAPTPSGAGYWLASANGAVSNFGDAHNYGSMAGKPLTNPVVGIASTTDGGGYWLVASDGGIFAFGNAIYDGSTGNITLNSPMVSLADI
jgi:hypothetical protein